MLCTTTIFSKYCNKIVASGLKKIYKNTILINEKIIDCGRGGSVGETLQYAVNIQTKSMYIIILYEKQLSNE